jgi:hypothetical protein
MNVNNINKLIAHLNRLIEVGNRSAFNMGHFYASNFKSKTNLKEWQYIRFRPLENEALQILPLMESFNSSDQYDCKTVACIAGHAVLLKEIEGKGDVFGDIESRAKDWLDLTEKQAKELFLPDVDRRADNRLYVRDSDSVYSAITLEHAVAALTSLRDTGVVVWPFPTHEWFDHEEDEYEEDES